MGDEGILVQGQVSRGAFGSEYSVRIVDQDRLLWEGTLDREQVFSLATQPMADSVVMGWVSAYPVKLLGSDRILVEFPGEGWSQGRRAEIPLRLTKVARLPA